VCRQSADPAIINEALRRLLPLPDIPGLAVYPKTPEVDDRSNRGELVGTRVESVTYVLQQGGEVTIPGTELQWWNPFAEQLNTETVPALTLEVASNPDQRSEQDPIGAALAFAVNHPWALVAAVAHIFAMAWAAFRWLPPVIRRWRTARRHSEDARFKRLVRACRTNDPPDNY
jgi:hypothetical protein